MKNDYYELFVIVHKLAVQHNLIEGVWNHVSFELPNTKNHILLTPGHTHWDLVNQNNISILDNNNAKYPAEHNVGHEYLAKPTLSKFYKELDPTNSFNPGIGKTSKRKGWK